jgi:CTP synthase
MVAQFEAKGLIFSGRDADKGVRMEICELPLKEHAYFFGCQFHPEYTSTPFRVSPPFRGLIRAAAGMPLTVGKAAPSPPPSKKQKK